MSSPNKADPYDNSGTGNMGACCAEMDLWEDGDPFIAPTDRDGCDINAYRMGETNFYCAGPQFQVNTERPLKVVTRFHAPAGELTAVSQFYVQDGKEIHHPTYSAGGDSIESDAFCAAQKTSFGDRNSFSEKGSMKQLGEALDRGHW